MIKFDKFKPTKENLEVFIKHIDPDYDHEYKCAIINISTGIGKGELDYLLKIWDSLEITDKIYDECSLNRHLIPKTKLPPYILEEISKYKTQLPQDMQLVKWDSFDAMKVKYETLIEEYNQLLNHTKDCINDFDDEDIPDKTKLEKANKEIKQMENEGYEEFDNNLSLNENKKNFKKWKSKQKLTKK